MAKSGAERQRVYKFSRQWRGEARLSMFISPNAKEQLVRLAALRGVSQRTVLEQLLAAAEDGALACPDAAEQDACEAG